MGIDIEKLKGLAEAAAPWTELGSDLVEVWSSRDGYFLATEPDMEFIAAANPAAVLELIAELQGYQQGADVEAQAADEARAEARRLKAENEDGLAVIRTHKEQLECYIKDAERYRWLRDAAGYCDTRDIPGMAPARMDAFIDAGIAQEQP